MDVVPLPSEWQTAFQRPRLSTLLQELAHLYRDHIAIEEGQVFPMAARSLTGLEQETIGGEMAARRGLSGAA